MLTHQMRILPDAIVVTEGPEVPYVRHPHPLVLVIPGLFTWLRKKRLFNPPKPSSLSSVIGREWSFRHAIAILFSRSG
jgi:hypothetical protein